MGLQLIFAVEADKKSKSDWIYMKDTIDYFYQYDQSQFKFSPVYMNGRGKYKNKEKEILKLISQYASTSKTNRSKVIYCFDCDDYDRKQADADFLAEASQYCKEKDYEFVWFCKDVECAYLGKKVDAGQKSKEAGKFKAKKLIRNVNPNKLAVNTYRMNTSNVMKILDRYLTRK